MPKEDNIEVEGIVKDILPNTQFLVEIGNGKTIKAYLSGKLRTNFIRIVHGDRVTVSISPYDLTVGRIIWRNKA